MILNKLFLFPIVVSFLVSCGKLEKSDMVADSKVLCSFTGKVNYQVGKDVRKDFNVEDVGSLMEIESSSCKNIYFDDKIPMSQFNIIRKDKNIIFVDNKQVSQTVSINSNVLTSMKVVGVSERFDLEVNLIRGEFSADNQYIIYTFKANSLRKDPQVQALNTFSNNEMISTLVSKLKIE